MGCPAKIKLSCCSLLNVLGNSFWKGFWVWNGGIFGSQSAFRSDFESKYYKVYKPGGVGVVCQPPPIEILGFGPPVGGIREGKVS